MESIKDYISQSKSSIMRSLCVVGVRRNDSIVGRLAGMRGKGV